MKRPLILLIILLCITGCSRKNSFTVEGWLKEPKQEYIYISKIDINLPVIIDSSKIAGNGKFSFRIKTGEPDFYQIGYSESDFANLLAEPGEKIRLMFNGTDLHSDYTVSGSEGSEQVQALDLRLLETKMKIDSLNIIYEKASKEPDFDKKAPILENEYLNVIKEQRRFNIQFILQNMHSLSAIKALYQRIDDNTYVLYETRDLQYLKIVSDTLGRYYPGSRHTKALISNFEQELKEFNALKFQMAASDLPEAKLDPDLKDINGRRIALSSLRGKYVLLAFWSAQSRDCITDNLQLKEFYRLYNRRGFEIYQINLDENESVWRTAVKYDELPWISTREDDPANPKNARLYNVQTLPMNYLYDPEGNIIGTKLHGRNLQIKLNQIFSN